MEPVAGSDRPLPAPRHQRHHRLAEAFAEDLSQAVIREPLLAPRQQEAVAFQPLARAHDFQRRGGGLRQFLTMRVPAEVDLLEGDASWDAEAIGVLRQEGE